MPAADSRWLTVDVAARISGSLVLSGLMGLVAVCPSLGAPAPTRPINIAVPAELDSRFFDMSCATLAALRVGNAKCLGAVGDGVADDTTVMRTLVSSASYSMALVPAGTYRITQGLTSQNPRLVGDNAVIRMADSVAVPAPAVLTVRYHGRVSGLTLDANHRAHEGVNSFKSHAGVFKDLVIRNAIGTGLHVDYTQGTASFENIVADGNGADGVWCESCNSIGFFRLRSTNNGRSGFRSTPTTTLNVKGASGGLYLSGGVIRGNAAAGVELGAVTSITVIRGVTIDAPADAMAVHLAATSNARIVENLFTAATPAPARTVPLIGMDSRPYNNLISRNASRFRADVHISPDGINNWLEANASSDASPTGSLAPWDIRFAGRNIVFPGSRRDFLAVLNAGAISFATGPPPDASWKVGDVVFNITPANRNAGWRCVRGPAAGCVWRSFGP